MTLVYLPENKWSTRYGPEYFTVAVIAYEVYDNSHAQYKLLVQNGKRNWTLMRRFSDFDAMRSGVRHWTGRKLPKLPPKTLLCRDLNPEFLARRRLLLNDFLDHLLVIPGVAEEQSVRDFLQLQSVNTYFV